MSVDFEIIDREPQPLKPGDAAEIGGPRGSAVAPHDFDWWLLVGDETALPAIGEELHAQL